MWQVPGVGKKGFFFWGFVGEKYGRRGIGNVHLLETDGEGAPWVRWGGSALGVCVASWVGGAWCCGEIRTVGWGGGLLLFLHTTGLTEAECVARTHFPFRCLA